MGTAAYMAPEQLRGERTGTAADLWALGVVLYEMLAGRRPFGGERAGMVHSILHEEPPPLREARPDVPAVLEGIVSRCLAKEPRGAPSAGRRVLSELQAAGLWEAPAARGRTCLAPARRWRPWCVAGAAILLLAAGPRRLPADPQAGADRLRGGTQAGDRRLALADDQARVTANIQAALLRTVAALEGLAALGLAQSTPVKGSPRPWPGPWPPARSSPRGPTAPAIFAR